ncbi:hypothetical protein PVAND_011245 [Polypedilum vanderplanki]|uniref:Major facilitator superfamily (MFS) profile domain-containing protein n=1 Tax=Polypedilum vanderplanki TaxID=319348 RepID=A0A9J6CIP7_POLVA|nr:hypothetical protein PVAND_011245 [Polypedilum vanderplanki]
MNNYKVSAQVLVASIASIGSLLYGIGLGWSSPSGVKILNTEKNFEITSSQFSWVVAMNSIGGCIGCLVTGLIRSNYGTKVSIFIFTIPSFSGWMLLAFAQAWWMLIIEIRGVLLSFYEITVKSGILFSYAIGSFTRQSITNAICGGIVVLYAIAFLFMPESPLYLMKQHKTEEAKKSLTYLRGRNYKMDDELTRLHLEIDELERNTKPFWQEIRTKATRKAFVIVMSMFIFFQLCGINAIIFYTTTILIESGITIDPFIATCMLGVIQVIGVLCSTALVDHYGRKILLIASNIIMIFGLLGVGIYFHLKEKTTVTSITWLPLVLFCIYFIGFSIGVGSVTYVLMGELISLNAKRVIGPMAQFSNFLMAFLIAIFFPKIANYIGMHYAFYIFAAFCFIAIIFIIVMLPETKGKSLVEIQNLLTNDRKCDTNNFKNRF